MRAQLQLPPLDLTRAVSVDQMLRAFKPFAEERHRFMDWMLKAFAEGRHWLGHGADAQSLVVQLVKLL